MDPKRVILGTSVKLHAGESFRDADGNRFNVGRSCGFPPSGKWMFADRGGRVVYFCNHCMDFEEEPTVVKSVVKKS